MDKIDIIHDFKSQQHDQNGDSIILLKKGDILQLKEDGIYFTRKINLENPDSAKENFNRLKTMNIK